MGIWRVACHAPTSRHPDSPSPPLHRHAPSRHPPPTPKPSGVLFLITVISSYKGGQTRKHMNNIWPAWPSEHSSKEREQKIHAAKQDTKTRHTDWNSRTEEHKSFPSFIHSCNTHGCQLTEKGPAQVELLN
eukprot:1148863-Pelagomonas_calceolata.AAC.4